MRKLTLLALAILLLLPFSALADSSDDTLKFYLSKSDVVLQGTILNEPAGLVDETGVPNFICEFRVSDVLKGDHALKDTVVNVNIVRFEMGIKDHHPLIKKDAESILFLKQTKSDLPRLETADFWFGVQHPFPMLAKSLKRLAKEEEGRTKPLPVASAMADTNTTVVDGYTICDRTNASFNLQVELIVPGFPKPERFEWNFKNTEPADPFLSIGPLIFPSYHDRQKGWRLSLVPKGNILGASNLLYDLTWRITDFTDRQITTNRAVLDIPLGRDFLTIADGVVVTGKWSILVGELLSDADRVELHLPARSDLTLAKDPDIQAARTIDVAVQRTVAEFLKPTGREFKITAARQVGNYILLWISFPKIDDGGIDLIYSVEKKRIVGEFFGGYRG